MSLQTDRALQKFQVLLERLMHSYQLAETPSDERY